MTKDKYTDVTRGYDLPYVHNTVMWKSFSHMMGDALWTGQRISFKRRVAQGLPSNVKNQAFILRMSIHLERTKPAGKCSSYRQFYVYGNRFPRTVISQFPFLANI